MKKPDSADLFAYTAIAVWSAITLAVYFAVMYGTSLLFAPQYAMTVAFMYGIYFAPYFAKSFDLLAYLSEKAEDWVASKKG